MTLCLAVHVALTASKLALVEHWRIHTQSGHVAECAFYFYATASGMFE